MHLGLRSYIIVPLPYSWKDIDFNLASLELTTPFYALVYYLYNLFLRHNPRSYIVMIGFCKLNIEKIWLHWWRQTDGQTSWTRINMTELLQLYTYIWIHQLAYALDNNI